MNERFSFYLFRSFHCFNDNFHSSLLLIQGLDFQHHIADLRCQLKIKHFDNFLAFGLAVSWQFLRSWQLRTMAHPYLVLFLGHRLGNSEVTDFLLDGLWYNAMLFIIWAIWIFRRRAVSSVAFCMNWVMVSRYMMTALAAAAARPMVWMSRSLRRIASLSASRMATRLTSGTSIPSRRKGWSRPRRQKRPDANHG